MTSRIIEWREMSFADGWEHAEPDIAIWVDVASFDAAWRQTDQWVGPGGRGGQDSRYAKFGVWFAEGRPVYMCNAWLEDGEVGFTNGRHRFAWLRDQGVAAMMMQIGKDSVAEFESRFATPLRQSVIPQT